METMGGHRSIYPGIFLISAATLNLELIFTRILSISQGYYFAFMVVSIALLGIGASGSFLMIWPERAFNLFPRFLFYFSLAFSISSFFSYIMCNLIPFDPVRISWDLNQIFWIGTYYLLLSIPFFFTGLTLGLALSRLPTRVNLLYLSDLSGAGIGGWIIYLVLGPTNEPGAVIVSMGMGALAAILFGAQNFRRLLIVPILIFIGAPLLLLSPPEWLQIKISPYKSLMTSLKYPGARLVSTRWDAFSRVDIVDTPAVRFAPGLSLRFKQEIPPQIGIIIDAHQFNAVTRFDGNKDKLMFTSYLPTALPYALKSIDKLLSLEPQGGLDNLTAIYHNVKSIEAVTLYPLIYKTTRYDLNEFSGGLFRRNDTRVYCEGIRSFFHHNAKYYDLIQYSLTDVSGAMSSGIHGISENYILTKEAIYTYYHHLNEGGFLVFNCYLLPPPRTEFRIISLLLSTLDSITGSSPSHQLIVIQSWGTMVTLVKKGRITEDECRRLKEFCQSRRFDLVYYPGISPKEANQYNRFPEPIYFQGIQKLVNPKTRKGFLRTYPFDLSPVSDDQPFFNQFFKVSQVREAYNVLGKKWQPFFEGEYIVPLIFVQALILGTILILSPLFFIPKMESGKGKVFLFYFIFIGLGFMFVEIALIQRFILFLDHPVKSVTVVLSGLLISAGVGSFLSGRIRNRFPKKEKTLIFIAGGLVFFYALCLPLLLKLGLNLETIIRTVFAIFMIFPLGLFMGMPFPLGVLMLNQNNPKLIPWAWGANGSASVAGSVLAVMIALKSGFSGVFLIASGLYLMAGLWMSLYHCFQSS